MLMNIFFKIEFLEKCMTHRQINNSAYITFSDIKTKSNQFISFDIKIEYFLNHYVILSELKFKMFINTI